MRRKQIPQITSSNWCPQFIKQLCAEFLSWFVLKINATKPFISVIEEVLKKSGSKQIVNTEFHVGAGIDTVKPFLSNNLSIKNQAPSKFTAKQEGVYTFINGFHQLPVKIAQDCLNKMIDEKRAMVIVEGNNDSLWQIVGMTVFVPLTVLLATPFVQPFRWSRLIFTYLIPILPIILVIDGCIALLKLYNPQDLNELIQSLNANNYHWETGKNDNGRGGKIIYLKGIPQ